MTALWTVLVVAGALALSAGVGYPVVTWLLRRVEGTTALAAAKQGDQQVDREQHSDPAPATAAELLRGGTWIGVLERLAISGAIMTGYPAGIAVVIAVKGLGRFPELRANTATSGVSERFIIGTLASGLWAAAIGVAARAVVLALG